METDKELNKPMTAQEFYNTKNFGTDFDFATEYSKYLLELHKEAIKNNDLFEFADTIKNDIDSAHNNFILLL